MYCSYHDTLTPSAQTADVAGLFAYMRRPSAVSMVFSLAGDACRFLFATSSVIWERSRQDKWGPFRLTLFAECHSDNAGDAPSAAEDATTMFHFGRFCRGSVFSMERLIERFRAVLRSDWNKQLSAFTHHCEPIG